MALETDLNTDFVKLPDIWDDWKVKEQIGTGSFGTVYLAVRNDEQCAIKVIQIPSDESERSALLAETQNEETTQQYLQDLIQNYTKEIKVMYTLKDDPHIVRIMGHEIEELRPFGYRIYIQMELLTSLRNYLSGRSVTEPEAVQIGLDICDALITCDRKHIIHRDIKPDNIFRSDDGIYKLGDFGTARQLDLTFGTYSAKGTFSFMAPEVYKGEVYNRQADIYSLGIVLYRFMNRNRDPFLDPIKQLVYYQEREDALRSRMDGEPIPPPVDASEKFAYVICKACAYKVEDRYEDAAELKADLEKVLDPYAEIAFRDGKTEDNKKTDESVLKNDGSRSRVRRFWPIGVLLIAVIVLGSGIGIYMYMRRDSGTGNRTQLPEATETAITEAMEAAITEATEAAITEAMEAAITEATEAAITEATEIAITEETIPEIHVIGENDEGFVPLRGSDKNISEGMQEALDASDDLVATLADATFRDRELFDSYFMNASKEVIDEYYIDFRNYNDYPYTLKVPVAQTGNVYMINYMRYMDFDQEQESDDHPWSKGFNLLMTKDADTWKINLDEENISELGNILLDGAYPSGYADNLKRELPNSIMEDHNNYLYISRDAVYENIYGRQVRFIWQDENGDLFVSILFTNASDQTYTFRNLRLKLNDRMLGTVIDVRLPGEVSVETRKNELRTYRIDASAVVTGTDQWEDVTANIIEESP